MIECLSKNDQLTLLTTYVILYLLLVHVYIICLLFYLRVASFSLKICLHVLLLNICKTRGAKGYMQFRTSINFELIKTLFHIF